MTAITRLPTAAAKKEILRTEDFICRCCRVQATGEADRVCELCKAVGKIAEPVAETNFWDGARLGMRQAKRHFFGSRI